MTVRSVSPAVPPATTALTPVTVTLSITNTGSDDLGELQLLVNRESPKSDRASLDRELGDPVEDDNEPSKLPSMTISGDLAAHQTRQVSYVLTASSDFSQKNVLCLCQAGVYPLDFVLRATSGPGTSQSQAGWAQTYVSSVPDSEGVQVSWLWPLLERPHRVQQDSVFMDDELAGSVSPGGRLDRALEVVEQAGVAAHLTLEIDPELIDELAVMSTGYTVEQDGRSVPGTGGAAARSWLARLRAVLPAVGGVSMTPYADPDVDAAARAGVSWSASPPPAMQQRITAVTGLGDPHDIAWPPAETITQPALDALTAAGATMFVLDDATLPGDRDASPELDALAPLGSSGQTALVTDRSISAQLDKVVDLGGTGLSELPALLGSVAMPAIQEPGVSHFRVLVPERYVDADPTAAVAAILATTTGPFTAIAARAAVASVQPQDHGTLTVPANSQAAEIPPSLVAAARGASSLLSALDTALTPAAASALLTGVPSAAQRGLSAGWRSDPLGAAIYTAALGSIGSSLTSAVQIVPPAHGYSLASNDAPLYFTVQNSLSVPVRFRITVTTVGGVKGLRTDDAGILTIPAESVRRVTVQTHVTRAGHFVVTAQLTTPSGQPLGATRRLSIYSNALGTIGTLITIGASSVLVLALLVRFVRRFRFRRRQRQEAANAPQPSPAEEVTA
jgi:hypothetical protein